MAAQIKAAIRAEVDLPASVGVATTKLVAKIASDLRKPDGLVVVPPGEEAAFLAPLPISRLWGVGEPTARALRDYGVRTIGDLAALDPDILVRRFGKHGGSLAERARGMDPDPVHDRADAKSIGHEHTFDVDTSDRETIERTLLAMAEGVAGRLRAGGLKAGTVTVKIRDSGVPDDHPPADAARSDRPDRADLADRAGAGPAGGSRDPRPAARRDGVEPGEPGPARAVRRGGRRKRRAVEAADELRRRFGERAVTRARLLGTGLPAPFERDHGTAVERRGRHAADLGEHR